jgi:hypothetical protein
MVSSRDSRPQLAFTHQGGPAKARVLPHGVVNHTGVPVAGIGDRHYEAKRSAAVMWHAQFLTAM